MSGAPGSAPPLVADGVAPEAPEEAAYEAYEKQTQPAFGQAQGAGYEEGFTSVLARRSEQGQAPDADPVAKFLNPFASLPSVATPFQAWGSTTAPESQKLSPEEINHRFAPEGTTITDHPMTPELGAIIGRQSADKMRRDQILQRFDNTYSWPARFGTGMANFMLDPLQAATAFVPGPGEGAILAHLGYEAGAPLMARLGARAASGFAGGVAAQAPLSAARLGLANDVDDYDLRQGFLDMMFAGGMNSLIHSGIGGLREAGVFRPDEIMAREPAAAPMVTAPPQANYDAMKTALGQVLGERPVEVQPIYDEAVAGGAARPEPAPSVRLSDHPEDVRNAGQQSPSEDFTTGRLAGSKAHDLAIIKNENIAGLLNLRSYDSDPTQLGVDWIKTNQGQELSVADTRALGRAIAERFPEAQIIRGMRDSGAKVRRPGATNEDVTVEMPLAPFRRKVQVQAPADVAESQRRLYSEGYAAGMPEGEFRAANTETYGDTTAAEPEVKAPGAETKSQEGEAKTPEEQQLADLEAKWAEVAPSAKLTPEERAELDQSKQALQVHKLEAETVRREGEHPIVQQLRDTENDGEAFSKLVDEASKLPAKTLNEVYADYKGLWPPPNFKSKAEALQAIRQNRLGRVRFNNQLAQIRSNKLEAERVESDGRRDAAIKTIAQGFADPATFKGTAAEFIHGQEEATRNRYTLSNKPEDMRGHTWQGRDEIPPGSRGLNLAVMHQGQRVATLEGWTAPGDDTYHIDYADAGGERQLPPRAVRDLGRQLRDGGLLPEGVTKVEGWRASGARGRARQGRAFQTVTEGARFKPDVVDQTARLDLNAFERDQPGGQTYNLETHPLNAEERDRTEQLRTQMQALVDKIAPGYGTKVFAKMGTETPEGTRLRVTGGVNFLRKIISYSLESRDIPGTVRHEALHALKEAGAFSDHEWSTLEEAARTQGWLDKLYGTENTIHERYAHLDEAGRLEEAIAEEVSKGRHDLYAGYAEPVRAILLRIHDFFAQVGETVRRLFGQDATAQDIMRQIERGQIGDRMVEPVPSAQEAMGAGASGESQAQAAQAVPVSEQARQFVDKFTAALDDTTGEEFRKTLAEVAALPVRDAIEVARASAFANVTSRKAALEALEADHIHRLRVRNENAGVARAAQNINSFIGGSSGSPLEGKAYDVDVPGFKGDKLETTGERGPREEQARQAAIQARTDALRNALVRNQILLRANAAHAQGGLKGATQVLRSLLVWDAKSPVQNSIESQFHALAKQWQAVVGNKVRQAGLERAAASGGLDYEIADEMWRLSQKGEMAGTPPDPKASPGKYLGQAFRPALDLARQRLNAAGAHIGSAIDYVTHTSWDARAMRKSAGPGATRDQAYAAWKALDAPRMADKTFEHLVPREGETMEAAKDRFLRSVFDATSTGVHLQGPQLSGMADDGGGYIPPAYEGTHNVARGVSQQRVVYWKDARSWVDHMKDFGGGHSIYANVMQSLEQGARKVALMEKLGTNPEANFNSITRTLMEDHRTDEDLEEFRKSIDGGYILRPALKTILSYLDGSANIPIHADRAQFFNLAATWEALSKLGGVALTHLAAAPGTISAELAHHGVSHLQGVGEVLKAIFTGRGEAELQDIKADVGAYAEGYNLVNASQWNQAHGAAGFISWSAANFMRLTGLPLVLNRLQTNAVKAVLMTRLGRAADYGAIHPLQANLLGRYGIGRDEWEILRSSPDDPVVDGKRYLTPAAATTADAGKIEDLLRRRGTIAATAAPDAVATAVQKYRWELGDQYLTYLNDAAEHSTVTPGARERAVLLRGAKPGSIGWMLARSISQFKSWPLAAFNQILGRELGYSLTRGQATANIGWILALSTAGGALRMAVNDAVNGRPQRDYGHPTTLLAAMAQGGGLGIYGDFLFGETSRQGAGWVTTAMGPVASDIDALSAMALRFRDDIGSNDQKRQQKAVDHLWPELVYFAKAHVPYSNLIYIKGALDYLLWYHLLDAASPGYWERTNRRLQKEQGRTMLGYTPGGGVPWGVPGAYLKTPGGKATGLLAPAQR